MQQGRTVALLKVNHLLCALVAKFPILLFFYALLYMLVFVLGTRYTEQSDKGGVPIRLRSSKNNVNFEQILHCTKSCYAVE